jgi:uncharacterized alpha-E superfamily protein
MSLLSRNGALIFRLGRYLQKAEFMVAYMQAHYLHYLDADQADLKKGLLESLLLEPDSRQQYFGQHLKLEEEKVLRFITIGQSSPASLKATVAKARELARGARDCIPADLWEYINALYLKLHKIDDTRLQQKGLLSYTKKARQMCQAIKGYVHTQMLRDDCWMLLNLGFHLERSMQACQLLRYRQKELAANKSEHEYVQLIAMLQSMGSYESYKKLYQQAIDWATVSRFIACNRTFPGSILFNLQALQQLSQDVGFYEPEEKDHLIHIINSLLKNFQQARLTADDTSLQHIQQELQGLCQILEQKYLEAIPA